MYVDFSNFLRILLRNILLYHLFLIPLSIYIIFNISNYYNYNSLIMINIILIIIRFIKNKPHTIDGVEINKILDKRLSNEYVISS
jgi:hypothetical protein